MLKVDDIHTYYGDSYILQGISLFVPKGTVVALLGRNGMGKTTLIRSVIGFTPPRKGKTTGRLRPSPFIKGYDSSDRCGRPSAEPGLDEALRPLSIQEARGVSGQERLLPEGAGQGVCLHPDLFTPI